MRDVLGLVIASVLLAASSARSDPFVPNDPKYSHQWYAATLNLPLAWNVSQGSPAVIVAVLDTGVYAGFEDLAGRLLAPLSATSNPTPLDGTAILHGTWVASVAAMGINNGKGGAGVGNFTILPITATNELGHVSSTWIANGIRMAADAGARAINVSLESLTYGGLDSAAAYAKTKGALTFVAAGNDDLWINRSGFDNLIFVAGTNAADTRWVAGGGVGSSYGPYVDLAAPAQNILVADPFGPTGYGVHSGGTSFAAPLAAGAAALAWSINPNLTPDQVRDLLFTTAVDLGPRGWDEEFGHGRIDIGAVAAAAAATVPEPATAAVLVLAGVVCLGMRGKDANR